MIEIDGSMGSGGGQVLRTCLALSAYTGKGFRINRIRAERPNPGLAMQHLKCVEAVAGICGADVEGAELGSESVEFHPGEPRREELDIDIGTAGSVTLLLQAALLPSMSEGSVIGVRGGTDVKWSPTWDYLVNVAAPLMERAGLRASYELVRRGYYPEGSGIVEVSVSPSEVEGLTATERGELQRVEGISHVKDLPRHIAERQAESATEVLGELPVDVDVDVVRESGGPGRGTGVTLWAVYGETVLGGSALGERGKPAEEVGREAAAFLMGEVEGDGVLDRFAADQVLPFLAIGGGRYTATERTSHLETNAETCRRFLESDIELEGREPVLVEAVI